MLSVAEPGKFPPSPDREWFEKMYRYWNRKEFVQPDPLQYVLCFRDPGDQEVAGLIASSLAYGRVGQILSSLDRVFGTLPNLSADLAAMSRSDLASAFRSFRHRWSTGQELSSLLSGVSLLKEDHGSLQNVFLEGLGDGDADVIPALIRFVARLRRASGRADSSLLACPSGGSACKRMLLYLRWMVRRDAVDPGPWREVSPALLVVPMDVHMHRVCREMGITARRQADLKSAREATAFFRSISSTDPVKYDFSLTRPGIRTGTVKGKGSPGHDGNRSAIMIREA